MDSYRIFHILFAVLNNMFSIAVRQNVNNLGSTAVVQEPALSINLALYDFNGVEETSITLEACLGFL